MKQAETKLCWAPGSFWLVCMIMSHRSHTNAFRWNNMQATILPKANNQSCLKLSSKLFFLLLPNLCLSNFLVTSSHARFWTSLEPLLSSGIPYPILSNTFLLYLPLGKPLSLSLQESLQSLCLKPILFFLHQLISTELFLYHLPLPLNVLSSREQGPLNP